MIIHPSPGYSWCWGVKFNRTPYICSPRELPNTLSFAGKFFHISPPQRTHTTIHLKNVTNWYLWIGSICQKIGIFFDRVFKRIDFSITKQSANRRWNGCLTHRHTHEWCIAINVSFCCITFINKLSVTNYYCSKVHFICQNLIKFFVCYARCWPIWYFTVDEVIRFNLAKLSCKRRHLFHHFFRRMISQWLVCRKGYSNNSE